MTPRRILVGGWLVFLLYSFPGYVMTEGADQAVDSRTGIFLDWHSVMMTEVWARAEMLVGGPPSMLFLQSLLLLLGTYYLLRRRVGDRPAAIVAVALLLVPPLIATTALICPEAQIASWLLAGFAMLLSERFGVRLGGLAMMVVVCGIRDGGSWAVLPIVLATFTWRTAQPRWRRIAIAFAAWIVVVLTASGLERALVDVSSERAQTRLAMCDIVGTLRYAGPTTDAEVRSLLVDVPLAYPDQLQKRARTVYGRELFYDATELRVFEPTETQAQRDGLYAARRATIRAMPGAYLVNRWHYFYRELGLSSAPWTTVYTKFTETERDGYAMSHYGHHSPVQRALIKPVELLGETFLFLPLLYLVLAVLLLGYAIWRRETLLITLLTSGLAYAASLFFFSTRAEYRDSHWLIAATLLSGFALIALRKWSIKTAE
jgi:hypothetical protein